MAERVEVVITARDEASRTLGKLESSFGKIAKGFLGVTSFAVIGRMVANYSKAAMVAAEKTGFMSAQLEASRVSSDKLSVAIGKNLLASLSQSIPWIVKFNNALTKVFDNETALLFAIQQGIITRDISTGIIKDATGAELEHAEAVQIATAAQQEYSEAAAMGIRTAYGYVRAQDEVGRQFASAEKRAESFASSLETIRAMQDIRLQLRVDPFAFTDLSGMGIAGQIQGTVAAINWRAVFDPAIQGMTEAINSALAEGRISEAEAHELFKPVLAEALATEIALGKMNLSEAGQQWADTFGTGWMEGVTAVRNATAGQLLDPAALTNLLQGVAKPSGNVLAAALEEGAETGFEAIGAKGAEVTAGVLVPMEEGFQGVTEKVQDMNFWVRELIATLAALTIPDEFEPGSPTPFELGLRGITGAMKDMVTMGLPSMAAGIGGMSSQTSYDSHNTSYTFLAPITLANQGRGSGLGLDALLPR